VVAGLLEEFPSEGIYYLEENVVSRQERLRLTKRVTNQLFRIAQ